MRTINKQHLDLRIEEEKRRLSPTPDGPDVVLDPIIDPIIPYSRIQTPTNWGYTWLGVDKVAEKLKEKLRRKVIWVVLDTEGTFQDHPALKNTSIDRYLINGTNEGIEHKEGHGYHVAGIIAGVHPLQPDVIRLGVSPAYNGYTQVIPAKGLNSHGIGYDAWLAAAASKAVDVYLSDFKPQGYAFGINGSFGGSAPMPQLAEVLMAAREEGVFLKFSAGNRSCSCFGDPNCSTVGYPAKLYGHAIAALNDNGAPSGFSSCGPEVDFASPGANIYSTYKDKGYVYASGTSMSSPMDAGIDSWLLAANPGISTQEELTEYKKKFVTDLYSEGHDIRTGYGACKLPDFSDNPYEDPDDDNGQDPGDDKKGCLALLAQWLDRKK